MDVFLYALVSFSKVIYADFVCCFFLTFNEKKYGFFWLRIRRFDEFYSDGVL